MNLIGHSASVPIFSYLFFYNYLTKYGIVHRKGCCIFKYALRLCYAASLDAHGDPQCCSLKRWLSLYYIWCFIYPILPSMPFSASCSLATLCLLSSKSGVKVIFVCRKGSKYWISNGSEKVLMQCGEGEKVRLLLPFPGGPKEIKQAGRGLIVTEKHKT